jgi:tetratricopeptide (TPR) repeat protein
MLDKYIGQWSSMYVQACEATNVRGAQSSEVLDLRMACLSDNLEQVRAFTDLFAAGDHAATTNAVTALQSLTPVQRCADVAALKSAVPLPRDERTLVSVNALRDRLRRAQALRDVLNPRKAMEAAEALLPDAEATQYRPLIAQTLEIIGCLETDSKKAEKALREAVVDAESAHDDVTAATAAADLIGVVGYYRGLTEEAEFWARLSNAMLDRVATPQLRIRSWTVNNLASVIANGGDFERALPLTQQAVALKRESLGPDHPDVAISLHNLSETLTELGRGEAALRAADEALDIVTKHGDPDTVEVVMSHHVRGDALFVLGRLDEAEAEFNICMKGLRYQNAESDPEMGHALHGLGDIWRARGDTAKALGFFEQAMQLRERSETSPLLKADTRFALARTLWDAGGDRARAQRLAEEARALLSPLSFQARQRAIATWLATHHARDRVPEKEGRRSISGRATRAAR